MGVASPPLRACELIVLKERLSPFDKAQGERGFPFVVSLSNHERLIRTPPPRHSKEMTFRPRPTSSQQQADRALHQLLNFYQELGGFGAVGDSVIGGEGGLQHLADRQLTVSHHRL